VRWGRGEAGPLWNRWFTGALSVGLVLAAGRLGP